MIHDKPLTSSLERRKTFDSPLANHFSAVMQRSQGTRSNAALYSIFGRQATEKVHDLCFAFSVMMV
jgi:hypothetical protein